MPACLIASDIAGWASPYCCSTACEKKVNRSYIHLHVHDCTQNQNRHTCSCIYIYTYESSLSQSACTSTYGLTENSAICFSISSGSTRGGSCFSSHSLHPSSWASNSLILSAVLPTLSNVSSSFEIRLCRLACLEHPQTARGYKHTGCNTYFPWVG